MSRIIILMGVSGSGKSTVGRLLAKDLGWRFYEGDDFHPQSNIQKMTRGIPLTDEDRDDWLAALTKLVSELDQQVQSAVVTCSALKQAYRDTLSRNMSNVIFVYLKGSYKLILKRIKSRQGHFMKPGLLKSQFDILEEPNQALVVRVSKRPDQLVKQIRDALTL